MFDHWPEALKIWKGCEESIMDQWCLAIQDENNSIRSLCRCLKQRIQLCWQWAFKLMPNRKKRLFWISLKFKIFLSGYFASFIFFLKTLMSFCESLHTLLLKLQQYFTHWTDLKKRMLNMLVIKSLISWFVVNNVYRGSKTPTTYNSHNVSLRTRWYFVKAR